MFVVNETVIVVENDKEIVVNYASSNNNFKVVSPPYNTKFRNNFGNHENKIISTKNANIIAFAKDDPT